MDIAAPGAEGSASWRCQADGRRLKGSTCYELQMAPEGCWQVFSDYLVRRIYLRVPEHMKREAETVSERPWPSQIRPGTGSMIRECAMQPG